VFAGVVGSLILGNKYSHRGMPLNFNVKGMFDSIMKVFKKILP